jgi:hypothetical protein
MEVLDIRGDGDGESSVSGKTKAVFDEMEVLDISLPGGGALVEQQTEKCPGGVGTEKDYQRPQQTEKGKRKQETPPLAKRRWCENHEQFFTGIRLVFPFHLQCW